MYLLVITGKPKPVPLIQDLDTGLVEILA